MTQPVHRLIEAVQMLQISLEELDIDLSRVTLTFEERRDIISLKSALSFMGIDDRALDWEACELHGMKFRLEEG